MIVGVQDVYVNVSEMERALAFYRDVLGWLSPMRHPTSWGFRRVGCVSGCTGMADRRCPLFPMMPTAHTPVQPSLFV